MYSQHLKQSMTQRRSSANICWMKEWGIALESTMCSGKWKSYIKLFYSYSQYLRRVSRTGIIDTILQKGKSILSDQVNLPM